MLKLISKSLIVAILTITFISPEVYGLVATGGAKVISAPPSVNLGNDDTDIVVFFESMGVTSTVFPVDIDVSLIGSLPYTWADWGDNANGTIASGTPYKSYYISYDPFNPPPGQTISQSGVITFDNPILGIALSGAGPQWTTNYLFDTKALGNPGTTYPNSSNGLEPGDNFSPTPSGDIFTISADGKTLDISSLTVNGPNVDQIRVITQTPEPSTYLALGSMLLVLGFLVRKQMKPKVIPK